MTGVFWTGFASGLALIVAIGSQNAFLLRQGLLRQHVLALVLFCSLSDAILIGAGVAGAGALVADKPGWLMASRYAGALFLAVYALYAARRVFRPAPLLASQYTQPGPWWFDVIMHGMLIAIRNKGLRPTRPKGLA